jgi:hypothetical protein
VLPKINAPQNGGISVLKGGDGPKQAVLEEDKILQN